MPLLFRSSSQPSLTNWIDHEGSGRSINWLVRRVNWLACPACIPTCSKHLGKIWNRIVRMATQETRRRDAGHRRRVNATADHGHVDVKTYYVCEECSCLIPRYGGDASAIYLPVWTRWKTCSHLMADLQSNRFQLVMTIFYNVSTDVIGSRSISCMSSQYGERLHWFMLLCVNKTRKYCVRMTCIIAIHSNWQYFFDHHCWSIPYYAIYR